MNTNRYLPLFVIALATVWVGCKKDKVDPLIPPAPINEEELITDAYIIFTDAGGNTYEWHAATDEGFGHDHGGGEHEEGEIHIHGDTLPAGTVLQAEIILLNRSVSPIDTISHEVLAEGDEHQFFFIPEGIDASFSYLDQDEDGLPIGLLSQWTTGAAGSGEVKVFLRHGLNKSAAGVSNGDMTNAGGSTDLEIHFPAVFE